MKQRQGYTTKSTQTENNTVTKQITKQRDQSAAVIGKEAPSTIPKLLHLVRLPRTHTTVQPEESQKKGEPSPIPSQHCKVSPILQPKSHLIS